MGGLRDQFLRFYETSEDVRRSALSEGLIALDTNVILSLYRFLPDARDELFVVMEQLGDRLWIPHQAALEFHQNRLNVIAEQEAFYGEVRNDLNKAGAAYIDKLGTFSSRVGLSRETVENLAGRVQKAHDAVDEQIGLLAEQANPVRLRNHRSDKVLARLEALLEGRVGEPLSANLPTNS